MVRRDSCYRFYSPKLGLSSIIASILWVGVQCATIKSWIYFSGYCGEFSFSRRSHYRRCSASSGHDGATHATDGGSFSTAATSPHADATSATHCHSATTAFTSSTAYSRTTGTSSLFSQSLLYSIDAFIIPLPFMFYAISVLLSIFSVPPPA